MLSLKILSFPKKNRAIFIDRDGTINIDNGYTYRVEDLAFQPGVLEGLAHMSNLGYLIIVVSNQSGIALGKYTLLDNQVYNFAMNYVVSYNGGRIDSFYSCPHPELKQVFPDRGCSCSKPNPGLLVEASHDYFIDFNQSWMIGDKSADILAGQAVGCKTLLVSTGYAGKEEGFTDVKPSYQVSSLLECAKLIEENTPAAPVTCLD